MTPLEQRFTILVITGLSDTAEPKLRYRPLISVTPATLSKLEKATLANPESSEWLGMLQLVEAAAGCSRVSIKLWSVSRKLLVRDIQRAPEPEQSALYKRVVAEGAGTFGGQPIGLILVDAYLGDGVHDADLAKGLQYVGAAAGAPVLIGITRNAREGSLPWWQSEEWRAVTNSAESRCLFALLPRWRRVGALKSPQVCLHPGYLVASRIAAAMREADLADAAANLLPNWHPPQAAAFAVTSLDVLWDTEFECAMDPSHRDQLHNAGVNVISLATLGSPGALQSLTPAIARRRPDYREGLARVLLSGQVWQRVQQHVRIHHRSESGASLAPVVRAWFAANIPINDAGEPLVNLRNVAVVKDKLRIGLVWHRDADGAMEQMEIEVPGIIDDRVPYLPPGNGVENEETR